MTTGVVIIGGGGHAKVVIESLRAAGETVAVIVDADQVVRDVQQPGSPVLAKMAEGKPIAKIKVSASKAGQFKFKIS